MQWYDAAETWLDTAGGPTALGKRGEKLESKRIFVAIVIASIVFVFFLITQSWGA